MFLKRFYDEKLAHASYLVACEASREALVVDPSRFIDQYVDAAARQGLRIAHVTETHIHADFVSGARELARRTHSRLYLSGAGGPDWRYGYAGEEGATLLDEGSCFNVGAIEVSVLHTPGHTPEHLTLLVADTSATRDPIGAFTGDFVFAGDVGRPDLLEKAARQAGTMETSARHLYASLQRFRELPDYIQIWPAHGAGSSCGKSLGALPQSTLGYERRSNWAFAVRDENRFVRDVLEGQPDPPRYFAVMKRINRDGPPVLGAWRRPAKVPPGRLEEALRSGAVVVDTRPARDYALGAVPGTINIPWVKSFTTWAGWLLPYGRDLFTIVDEADGSKIDRIARDLSGIGLDRLAGYFDAKVIEDWGAGAALQTIGTMDASEVERAAETGSLVILDVRSLAEWGAGHLPGGVSIPLGELPDRIDEIPRDRPVVVHCQSGSRAAIAASLLLARGLEDVRVFPGGFAEWKAEGRPTARG